MIRTTVAAGIAAACAAFGQSAAGPLNFEAASIKPTPLSVDGRYAVRSRADPGRLEYSSFTLKAIVQQACEVRDFQISGPDWMASTRFDVVATLPAGAPRSGVPGMLRSLLAERFKMSVHRETRDVPVYVLLVGKSGPHMKEAAVDPNAPPPDNGRRTGGPTPGLDCGPTGETAPPAGWMINKGPGHLQGHTMNMVSVANTLAALLGRPVVDQTGLKAGYDFDLDYAPTADVDGVSIFTAVQSQLGLKLDAKKGPVEFILVDHAEKTPVGN